MDLQKVLRELYEEKKRLEEVIASLEALQSGATARGLDSEATPDGVKRRGRKSMGPEERTKVSQRMKTYWAGKRRGALSDE
jgi:hypothetical protein